MVLRISHEDLGSVPTPNGLFSVVKIKNFLCDLYLILCSGLSFFCACCLFFEFHFILPHGCLMFHSVHQREYNLLIDRL